MDCGRLACFNLMRDFPGGLVVTNPPPNAGDMGSSPGRGTKIPHAAGQLSPCATTTERVHLNLSLCAASYTAHAPWRLQATTRERKPTCHNWREACATQQRACVPQQLQEKRFRAPQQRSHVPQLRPDAAKNK